jgi:DNA mismatch endonuclease (patch repair protein)
MRYRVGLALELGDLKVRPDVVFTRAKIAVHLDGCYWHGCPTHGRMPSDPTGYWRAKISRNQRRDVAVDTALRQAGWLSIRVWEHENAADAAIKVHQALTRRYGTDTSNGPTPGAEAHPGRRTNG